MGVYIRGMDMPKYCDTFKVYLDEADNVLLVDTSDSSRFYTLAEVKVPHGDLIDRDATLSFIDAGHLSNPATKSWSDTEVVDMLESRPTVLEAEG